MQDKKREAKIRAAKQLTVQLLDAEGKKKISPSDEKRIAQAASYHRSTTGEENFTVCSMKTIHSTVTRKENLSVTFIDMPQISYPDLPQVSSFSDTPQTIPFINLPQIISYPDVPQIVCRTISQANIVQTVSLPNIPQNVAHDNVTQTISLETTKPMEGDNVCSTELLKHLICLAKIQEEPDTEIVESEEGTSRLVSDLQSLSSRVERDFGSEQDSSVSARTETSTETEEDMSYCRQSLCRVRNPKKDDDSADSIFTQCDDDLLF